MLHHQQMKADNSSEEKKKKHEMKLISFNAKLNGIHLDKSFKEIQINRTYSFRVLHIETPFEFYLDYLTSGTRALCTYQRMQYIYNSESTSFDYRVMSSVAFRDRVYVWRASSTDEWHRVRLFGHCYPLGSAPAFDLDDFVDVNVNFDDLKEMHADLYRWSNFSVRAYLEDVKPPNGLQTWPQESIDAFKKLCDGDKSWVFQGIVASRRIISLGSIPEQPQLILGLILLPKTKRFNETVQSQLVSSGHAEVKKKRK